MSTEIKLTRLSRDPEGYMVERDNGEWVGHAEALAIITPLQEEIERLKAELRASMRLLYEADRLSGHDEALDEWREKLASYAAKAAIARVVGEQKE